MGIKDYCLLKIIDGTLFSAGIGLVVPSLPTLFTGSATDFVLVGPLLRNESPSFCAVACNQINDSIILRLVSKLTLLSVWRESLLETGSSPVKATFGFILGPFGLYPTVSNGRGLFLKGWLSTLKSSFWLRIVTWIGTWDVIWLCQSRTCHGLLIPIYLEILFGQNLL